MEGEDLATTVLTCEGDITDPAFPFKLQLLVTKLQHLISDEEKPIKVTKVEPWNSVRVTFNIPLEAAQRLRQLAERGDRVLRDLGILSVQIEGDQVITLTIAGQFNEPQEIVLRKTGDDQNEVASLSFNLPNSEPVPGPSSAESAHKNISNFLGHIVGGTTPAASASATSSSTRVELPDLPSKAEPSVAFRSPNVIAPSSSEPIPFPSTTPVTSTAVLRPAPSATVKSQTTFGPFPFASMTHAMNTKHSSSSPVHKSGTSPRLPFTATTTILTAAAARSSAFSNANVTLAVTRPQTALSPSSQKPTRPLSNPVFNNIVSRGAPPNSVVPVSRANVALSSPLLVNLLQSETSNLQGHNKLMPPPAIAANQAAKRKRKPRKPKEKTSEEGNLSSSFTTSPSPPSPHVGLRSPVGLDSIANVGQPFSMSVTNIPLSPPTSQLSNLHSIAKTQPSGSAIQAQTANIHPQAQGQPPVSLHAASVQGQPHLSNTRHMQGQPAISAMHRQTLVHHQTVPNIHPQAQGQPQVHTGNLPLHTHIPVGSPQLARPPPNSLPSYAMSVSRGTTTNTNRMLFANRDSGLIIKPLEKPNRDVIKPSYKPSTSSALSNSTPESNPFPSPPSSSDGKTKHLINPFTGQLESASDDEEEDESIGSLPPFPDFEVENSENGQSERSLSDGGKENNLSSDTDSGISKSHTDISQSSSEGAAAESGRDQKRLETVSRAETVSSASVTSSVPGEKLKLRLKLDPKTIRESKETELKEKKLKETNNPTVNQKMDVGLTCISGAKKSTVIGSTTIAPEPRVPPLHISLRGPNSAVVVSPRKEDAKTKHSLGKDRSPRGSRTSDPFGLGVSGTSRLSDPERRMKSAARDCKKGKDDYWNQNVKNMSGGGIVEMSEKLPLSHSSSFETYLPNMTVGAGTVQRKPSLSVRDSCKSDVITLTSCATGESVSIHTTASSRSPLPFHLVVNPESDNMVAVSSQQSHTGNSSVQIITSLPDRTSKSVLSGSRNHVQEPADNFGIRCERKKETSSILGARKSSQFMQKGHLPHSPNMQTDSRNCVQKATRSNNPPPLTSANCVPITSTVPPVSSHSVYVVSATQSCATSVTPVVTSTVDSVISGTLDANKPFLEHKTVSKSHVDGVSPSFSDKRQASNQCNINSSSVRLDVSENALSSVLKPVQNEKPFSNSYSDSLYTKDKVLITEVQMNTSVNKDSTANNFDISKNDVNCSNDSKVVAENSVDSPVNVKQPFVEKEAECKDSVFSNFIDRCVSPLASIVSVTKREIIKDAMDISEKGLRLIDVKKPPIAQIITMDSIPIQSRVIEVPSLSTSLSVPNSIVKSDLALEVSSIPSLIPSHGGVFLPPRSTLVLQERRNTSLINDSGRNSPEFNPPKVSSLCSDSYPNTRLTSSKTEDERTVFNDANTDGKNSKNIKGEEDCNEQGSSTVPSEESSMDSIDEERKRCLLVSEVRTSTPGPPNDTKSEDSGINNCTSIRFPSESEKDISQKSHTISSSIDVKNSSLQTGNTTWKQSTSHVADNSVAVPIGVSTEVDVSRLKESRTAAPSPPLLTQVDGGNNTTSSAGDEVKSQNSNLLHSGESSTADTSANESSEAVPSVDSVPMQVSPTELLPVERTTPTPPSSSKIDDVEIMSDLISEAPHSTLSNQSLKRNPVCEPISVVCTSSNPVVTSLLSQGGFLSPEVGSGGRVRLIFKGSNPHSVLSSRNSPTSVVLPLNTSKTVPIKLVTLPGGAAGLSVRSTSNPNVVEIIGPKPPAVHNAPASGSHHPSSPVRLVVSKVPPNVSCSNQIGSPTMRNRVVVKSVVVTGTSSPIKLVSTTSTSVCSSSTLSVTSSATIMSFAGKSAVLSSSPITVIADSKSTNTEQAGTSESSGDRKIDTKKHEAESSDDIRCHSPFQPVSNHSDIAMISSSPEVSISSLSSSSSLCSITSGNNEESTQNKLENINEISENKVVSTSDDTASSQINNNKVEGNLLENILHENFPANKTDVAETIKSDNEFKSHSSNEKNLDCANVSNQNYASSKEETSGANETIVENSRRSEVLIPSPNLSTMPHVSSVELCTNSPNLTLEEPCLVAREITVGSEVQIVSTNSEQCVDEGDSSLEVIPKCNTDNCDEVDVDQTFLFNTVQNEICISPEVVIKSEDVVEDVEISEKKVKKLIRPFKEPKMESKTNKCGVNTCVEEEREDEEKGEESKGAEKDQPAATLVYSKPVKRKCSENAAELIKACMGVEDGPKRGLILKPKEEVIEKVEPAEKVEEEGGRMSLRVRRDDSTKKCKDCSSDEELPLSELVSKMRTRERPTRARPCSRDTPTELINCRPGRRRSGSNESQKSDEVKLRNRECKREPKKEEIVKKMPERTKRGVFKAQSVQRGVHIKDNELKPSNLNIKDETNAKRKTRSTGNTETAAEVVPGKRRRYSKDGHR